jgi:hypothetical protein
MWSKGLKLCATAVTRLSSILREFLGSLPCEEKTNQQHSFNGFREGGDGFLVARAGRQKGDPFDPKLLFSPEGEFGLADECLKSPLTDPYDAQ